MTDWKEQAKRASDSINQLTNGSIKYAKGYRLYEVIFPDTYPDSVEGSRTEMASIVLLTDVDDTEENHALASKKLAKIVHEYVEDLSLCMKKMYEEESK
ncbi:MAG: hypothetical protein H8D92_01905 [Pelagibacteraceae bacterium]|nr:hypothetical protein [Pelagibacteraceae bacterium]